MSVTAEKMADYAGKVEAGFVPMDPNVNASPEAAAEQKAKEDHLATQTEMQLPADGGGGVDPLDSQPNDVLGRIDSEAADGAAKTVHAGNQDDRGVKNYGRYQRDNINKSAAVVRTLEMEAQGEMHPEFAAQRALMEAEASSDVETPQQLVNQIETGVVTPGAETPVTTEVTAEAAAAEAAGNINAQLPADAPIQTEQKVVDTEDPLVRMVVDGVTQYAKLSEVVEAGGVDTLQIRRSAHIEKEQSATYRRGLETQSAELNRREGELDQMIRTLAEQQVATEQASTTSTLPASDGPASEEAGVSSTLKDASQAIFIGEPDKAAALIQKAIDDGISAGLRGTTAPVVQTSRVDELVTKMRGDLGLEAEPVQTPVTTDVRRVNNPDEQAANTVYSSAFPDLVAAAAARPEVAQAAARKMTYFRGLPENQGRSLSDIAIDVGNSVKAEYMPAGQEILDTALPAEQVAQIMSRKRKSPALGTVTSPGATAQPIAQANSRETVTANAFASIQKSRGQGRNR